MIASDLPRFAECLYGTLRSPTGRSDAIRFQKNPTEPALARHGPRQGLLQPYAIIG